MKTVRLNRRRYNRLRIETHYDKYQKIFSAEPHRPQGTNFVPGIGDYTPTVVFVGEAPGEDEDRVQMPFVGKAGRLLQDMMAQSHLIDPWDDNKNMRGMFITNLVKYRPPDNKLTDEVATPAYPLLREEIQILKPRVVVPLGKWSAAAWFQQFQITHIQGQVFHKEGVLMMPMLHPSYVLRQTDKKAKKDYLKPFKELKAMLDAL